MESILTQLTRQETWEEFLAYRLMKGRFTWHEFDEADTYVEREEYLPLAQRIIQGEGLGIPQKKIDHRSKIKIHNFLHIKSEFLYHMNL